MTVGEWCDTWLHNYSTRKKSTRDQAQVHVKHIKAEFGDRRLDDIKPLEISAWMVAMADSYKPSYVAAMHQRMAQIYIDAIHNNLVARSPLSRRTSPGRVSRDRMWRLRRRYGLWMRQLNRVTGQVCCWRHSQGCGSRRSAGCGGTTSITHAAS